MKKIAIIEDDRLLNRALEIVLRKEQYETISAFSCTEARDLKLLDADLVLMDIGLPGGDGISLCREIRKKCDVPFIFLTARDEERDMLEAFDAGADDYVVKPFPMKVLVKRIEAVLRRNSVGHELQFGSLEIDLEHGSVRRCGEEISLTAKEYKLLEFFVLHKGQVLSKEQILEQVWDLDGSFVGDNTVSVTVNRLRKKLGTEGNPELIKNIFGRGYRFGE